MTGPTCTAIRASCRCREPEHHYPETPHVCPCGGSWHYDDKGTFCVGKLPPDEIRDDLRYDKEW